MERSLQWLMVYRVLMLAPIWGDFWALAYLAHGFTPSQLTSLFEVGFSLAFVVRLVIGRLADRWGYKPLLLLGSILCALGAALRPVNEHTYGYAVVVIGLLEAGTACYSGADSSMGYEAHKVLGRPQDSEGYERKLQGFLAWGNVLSGVIGSLSVWAFGLNAPLILGAAAYALTIPVAFRLTEPERQRASRGSASVLKAFRCVARTPRLQAALCLRMAILTSMFCLYWVSPLVYSQLRLSNGAQVPAAGYGVVQAVFWLSALLFNRLGAWVFCNTGRIRGFLWIFVGALGFCTVMALLGGWWMLLFVLGSQAFLTACGPMATQWINELTPSDIRSTMASIAFKIYQVGTLGTLWLVGYMMRSAPSGSAITVGAFTILSVCGLMGAGAFVWLSLTNRWDPQSPRDGSDPEREEWADGEAIGLEETTPNLTV
jgi:MFS family permease